MSHQPSTTINVAAHLPAMAAAHPLTLAIVQPRGLGHGRTVSYRHFTYRELDAEIVTPSE